MADRFHSLLLDAASPLVRVSPFQVLLTIGARPTPASSHSGRLTIGAEDLEGPLDELDRCLADLDAEQAFNLTGWVEGRDELVLHAEFHPGPQGRRVTISAPALDETRLAQVQRTLLQVFALEAEAHRPAGLLVTTSDAADHAAWLGVYEPADPAVAHDAAATLPELVAFTAAASTPRLEALAAAPGEGGAFDLEVRAPGHRVLGRGAGAALLETLRRDATGARASDRPLRYLFGDPAAAARTCTVQGLDGPAEEG